MKTIEIDDNSMQGRLIDEARDLLNEAEKETNASLKMGLCSSALDLLDECAEDEPSSKEFTLIQNIKIAFARSVPTQIKKMNMDDIKTTEFFFNIFILKFAYEIATLCKENPGYDKDFNWWVNELCSDLIIA